MPVGDPREAVGGSPRCGGRKAHVVVDPQGQAGRQPVGDGTVLARRRGPGRARPAGRPPRPASSRVQADLALGAAPVLLQVDAAVLAGGDWSRPAAGRRRWRRSPPASGWPATTSSIRSLALSVLSSRSSWLAFAWPPQKARIWRAIQQPRSERPAAAAAVEQDVGHRQVHRRAGCVRPARAAVVATADEPEPPRSAKPDRYAGEKSPTRGILREGQPRCSWSRTRRMLLRATVAADAPLTNRNGPLTS